MIGLSAPLLALQLTIGDPAVAVAVTGKVEVEVGGSRHIVRRFEEIPGDSTIRTGDDGATQLRFASGTLVRLGPSTEVHLNELNHSGSPAGRRKESLRLLAGRVWARVTRLFGDDSKFEVETDTAVAGVRGTSFVVEAGPDSNRFILLHGALEITNDEARIALEQPGSALTATLAGLGAPVQLDPASLLNVTRRAGGTAAILAERVAPTLPELPSAPAPRGGDSQRRNSRDDIVGPSGSADANFAGDRTGGGGQDAFLDVQILLPPG